MTTPNTKSQTPRTDIVRKQSACWTWYHTATEYEKLSDSLEHELVAALASIEQLKALIVVKDEALRNSLSVLEMIIFRSSLPNDIRISARQAAIQSNTALTPQITSG
jgi:hypothetical protein